MSVQKLDSQFVKEHLDNMMANLKYQYELLEKPMVNLEGRAGTYHGASLTAMGIGLWSILLGDFPQAQEYFDKSIELKNRSLTTNEENSKHFTYSRALEMLIVSILTLDKSKIHQIATELEPFFEISLNEQSHLSRNWSALVKAMIGLILNWDMNKMGKLKLECKNILKNAKSDGALNVIWSILENNLNGFITNYQKIMNSEKQTNHGAEKYISSLGTALVVLAFMRNFDFRNFDFPMVPIDYLKLLK